MSSQNVKNVLPKLIDFVKAPSRIKNVDYKPKLMEQFAQEHKLLSYPIAQAPKNVAHVGGDRSYVLIGSLARLERALAKWSMNELVSKHNFKPVVVPNILYDHIIENCGFPTDSKRSQVYKISGNNQESIQDFESSPLSNSSNRTHSCLAGTSEFALVSIHIGDTIPADELPKKYCALSRCYRAETSAISSEWGLYRVHYFNKVEMVGLTKPSESCKMHEEFLQIQRGLYTQLGLQFKVLDMPAEDLGESATKKYDIEAWMCGREKYGEISSTSNCTDYQSSRLNIKYSEMIEQDNQLQVDTGFVHTVNGTALSTIRTLIALIEQHQTDDGEVHLPDVLVPYMDGIKKIPCEKDKSHLDLLNLYPTQ